MSKETSLALKGVAILLMLYFHLFNEIGLVERCTNFCFIDGMPLAYLLSRFTHPVEMFVILSGYGLYFVYCRGGYDMIKKIKSLYIHYWISLLLFIPLGAILIGPETYPGSFDRIISNVTGWYTNWNGTIWFLFPYCLLAFSSSFVFRIIDRVRPLLVLCVSFVFSLVGMYLVSRFGGSSLYECQILHMPIIYVNLLFSFLLGAYLLKLDIIKKVKLDRSICWILLLLLIIVRCCFRTGAFHSIFSFLFVILFAKASRPVFLNKFLIEMGNKSTSMWFVHAFFCYYYFKDFIYSFKYIPLVFIALLVCSYVVASILNMINKRIQSFLLK